MFSGRRFLAKGAHAILPLLFAAALAASDREYVVSTIAGGLAPATGSALVAPIGSLSGLAVDSAGNAYVSSVDLDCVFKIDPAGVLTRVAGTGRPGYSGDGGPANNAQLHAPRGLAVDAVDALYIADSGNQVVRKVTRDGTITTVGANSTRLLYTETLAVDAAGNLYAAFAGRRIQRISMDGTVTTLAGDGSPGDAGDGGPAVNAKVDYPNSLAADAAGNVYISDMTHNKVRRISASGTITTVAGNGNRGYSGDGGPATSAQLAAPSGLAADREGNLYIVDLGNRRVRKVSASGTITTVAGNGGANVPGDVGPTLPATFMPAHLAVDNLGNLYLAWGSVRKISPSGVIVTLAANGSVHPGDGIPAAQAQLSHPGNMMVDPAGNLYIADDQIRKVTPQGIITTMRDVGPFCDPGGGGPATSGRHLALDRKGSLYISESRYVGENHVCKLSPDGTVTRIAGTGASGFAGDGGPASHAELNRPQGIAVDSGGNVYVADMANYRVRKIALDGTIGTVAGNGTPGHGGDGGPAAGATLYGPGELAVDSNDNLYVLEYQDSFIRKVTRSGTISTVASVPGARAMAVDAGGTVYVVTRRSVFRLSPEGRPELIGGTGEEGSSGSYSGDGGPALDAHFNGLTGIAVDRAGNIYVSETNAVRMLRPAPLPPPESAAEGPSDLKIELRSATGINRFRIGEVIPLEVALSSSAQKRYLEPCGLSHPTHFILQCPFFSRWSFQIRPAGGWVDLKQEFPSGLGIGGGPSVEVPSRDLSSTPLVVPYVLTNAFRFDRPGEYRVRLSMEVGLDDEATRDRTTPPRSVTVKREIALQIVPASAKWEADVIHKGSEAYSRPVPTRDDLDAVALCNLGSEEAARVLAKLLAQRSGTQECLERTASPSAAIQEMQRLLVDPDVAVSSAFFGTLVRLLSRNEARIQRAPILSQQQVDSQRELLFSALPFKRGEAQIVSLDTVLAYPPRSKGTAFEFPYDLTFEPAVISAAAANYDRLPRQSQEWFLDGAWNRIRSPLMLPVVGQRAQAGDGQALLRWLDLDPAAATVFVREEVVRPEPRFSSFYLRLPDASLPRGEERIAANFVALTKEDELARAASLLHRYATGAVLPAVLPFIDGNLAGWPCSVKVPVLAYLLKVSPHDAAPKVQQAVGGASRGPCRTTTFFSDLGFLQPSPVLEPLALAEIEKGDASSLATDAAAYLKMHGSPATKPLLFERLVKLHQSGASSSLVAAVTYALAGAHAWVLSTQESDSLRALLGKETASQLSCSFRCGAPFGLDPTPHEYAIYGRATERFERRPAPMEYLNPAGRLHYAVEQFNCPDMKALKEKILQFPAGSRFIFAWSLNAGDREELVEISDFLWSHGYKVRNPQQWTFLRPDSF